MFAMGIEVHQGPRASDLFEKNKALVVSRAEAKSDAKAFLKSLCVDTDSISRKCSN